MPYYDYRCAHCGDFELRRSLSESNTPAHCPQCGASAQRKLSAPYLAGGSRPETVSGGGMGGCGSGACGHKH